MRRIPRLVSLAAIAACLCPVGSGLAQDAADMDVLQASVRFASHRRSSSPRHTLRLKGVFPSGSALREFDPSFHPLRVTVSGVDVIAVEPSSDAKGYRLRSRRQELRRWRHRARGEPGAAGRSTFSANVLTRKFNVVVRKADLGAIRAAGERDVPVSVTIGPVTAEATISFLVTDRPLVVRWHYRFIPPGPGPAPGPPPPPPPPPGPSPDPGGGPLKGGVLATFSAVGETFHVWTTNAAAIQDLFALQAGTTTKNIPAGPLRTGAGPGDHNAPWSWHIDPAGFQLVEAAMEACDGRPSVVEKELALFLKVGVYCPWSTTLVSLQDHR
jgi:hypothetical protein